MSRRMLLIAAGISLLLAACSIQPEIEDFTGVTGNDVVVFTRCNAREGSRAHFTEVMRAYKQNRIYNRMTGEELADWLESNPKEFANLKYSNFRDDARKLLEFYKDTGITYDFTMESNEINTLGFDMSVRRSFSNGLNRIGIGLQNDRTRDAKRTQRHFDTLDSLRLLPQSYCNTAPRFANFVFPSLGVTKVGELVRDFTVANQNLNLIGGKETLNIPEMTSTITFTTKTAANIGPGWELDPVRGAYIATGIGAKSDNSRQDKHQIIVIVQGSDPKKKQFFDEYGRIISREQALKQSGSDAVDRTIDRNFLQSFGPSR